MMNRFVWFWVAAAMGVLLLICGYLVPAHIRATDASVLYAAGRNTPSLADHASQLLKERKLGAAQLLSELTQAEGLPERSGIVQSVAQTSSSQPRLIAWGAEPPSWIASGALPRNEPFTEFVVRKENRERLIKILENSKDPGANEMLRCRELTNTVIFPPSWTSSGQAFDAALTICGLLMMEDHLHSELSGSLRKMAVGALRGQSPHRLEHALLDLTSLGQRLNWGQISVLVKNMKDTETLRYFANIVRRSETDLPALFSASVLTGDSAGVVRYTMNFANTGIRDLRAAMHYKAGGLKLLIERNKRLRHSPLDSLLNHYIPFDYLPRLAWKSPAVALALKWVLYLAAGYFFALAVHVLLVRRARRYETFTSDTKFLRRSESAPAFDLPPVRGIHVARELLFALGFLLFFLLISEPFLSQDVERMDFPLRIRLPVAAAAAAPGPATTAQTSFMNQLSLLTLLLFFVLQALIYTACMFKLAEIRRQKVGPRMKIKLLDNEDHLFDAGLYLGFVGTIISLILVSLGVIKPSLMAAYSSTSFGIIFVSFFKIFNLRPLKRRLLLEAEAVGPEETYPDAVRPQAAP